MADLTAMLEPLAALYEKTGHDWVLEISHVLTEPTCPTVIIRPEGVETSRYRVDADTIEEGIQRAVDLVTREVLNGQPGQHEAPYTDPDDRSGLMARIIRGDEVRK